jgi:hypothetical protein
MHVLVTELADRYRLALFPFVHWRHAALLLLPVAVQQERSVAVWLLSNASFFLVEAVERGVGIFWMVDASHAVGVSSIN